MHVHATEKIAQDSDSSCHLSRLHEQAGVYSLDCDTPSYNSADFERTETHEIMQFYAGAPPPPPPVSKPALRSVDEPMTREEEDMDLLDFVNTRVFGNPCFRPQQREVIKAVMAGSDVFVLMPTGGGDALSFRLRAAPSAAERSQ